MLIDDLYHVKEEVIIDKDNIKIEIELNVNHTIFQAHFPNNPIMPGVCIINIVKELLMVHYKRKVRLEYADNIKFLEIINPNLNPRLHFNISTKIEDNKFVVNSICSWEEVVFCKFKGRYV